MNRGKFWRKREQGNFWEAGGVMRRFSQFKAKLNLKEKISLWAQAGDSACRRMERDHHIKWWWRTVSCKAKAYLGILFLKIQKLFA